MDTLTDCSKVVSQAIAIVMQENCCNADTARECIQIAAMMNRLSEEEVAVAIVDMCA